MCHLLRMFQMKKMKLSYSDALPWFLDAIMAIHLKSKESCAGNGDLEISMIVDER